ncbi:T9SS type A sorting domain-containing protein, partial [Flavobacteriaceae bacterium]|nr:T9SS type A sorting domain-containing protein [Flavobacteriaceae bacterium]
ITIAAPEPLNASSRYNKVEKLVTYNVRGSESYYIELNGVITKYETSEVHLKLAKGQNRIRIYTDLPCQGFFEEEIFVSEEVLYYPNPTKGPLQLYISGEDTVVSITISNAYGSVLEVIEKEVPSNRVTAIDLTSQPVGIYLIRIEGPEVQQIIKIIKQ